MRGGPFVTYIFHVGTWKMQSKRVVIMFRLSDAPIALWSSSTHLILHLRLKRIGFNVQSGLNSG